MTTIDARSKQRTIGTGLLTFTAVVYAIFMIGFCWRAYAKATAAHVGGPAATVSTGALTADEKLDLEEKKLEVQQKYLDDRTKDLDKRGDDLERLIAELTIGSSAYTLLLGLFAFFGLKGAASEADRYLGTLKDQIKTFKEDAEKDLAARSAEFSEFQREIRDEIPNLYGMQKALNLLLNRIRRVVDTSQIWTRGDSYNDMPEEQRQKVIVAEMTVASFDYFRLDSSQVQKNVAAQIFSGLGSFYSGRARKDASRYDPCDTHRARLYLDRAVEMNPASSQALAQRAGFVLSNTAKEGDRPTSDQMDEAERDLDKCLLLDPSNVSGLYNKAWIADERLHFADAVTYLSQVIAQKNLLPEKERGRRMIAALMNRACAQAKIRAAMADPAEQRKIDAAIVADCQEGYAEAIAYRAETYIKKSLNRELGAKGELQHMASDPGIVDLVQKLSTVP